jgi:hypothetical protein
MKRTFTLLILAFALPGLTGSLPAAPTTTKKKTTKSSTTKSTTKSTAKPAATTAVPAPVTATDHPSPAAAPAVKKNSEGEMTADVKGQNREKLVISKLDPPAAFNLEDIQNFPEDRLQPLLNSPVTFNEGRDFSNLMDFKEDQPIHPWLPEIAKAPFLEMKSPALEKSATTWDFAIIDQAGATVSKISGKGTPPGTLTWNGDDTQRGRAAIDTVYIPQLNTVDKEGYHHTYMGQPIQFSSVEFSENGKTTIELSTKRLFLERKAEFTKEGPMLLDKVCDVIREGSHLPFAVQPFTVDDTLGQSRQAALIKYFKDKLFIPSTQIVASATQDAGKRGEAMAIISTTVPGGNE